MKPEEQAFASALTAAIVADIGVHPTDGPVDRLILRWFQDEDPGYFTVHALGADEQEDIDPDDAWLPLEWPNLDREIDRADRIAADPAVAAAIMALTPIYEEHVDTGIPDPEDDWGPSLAITEAVRAVPDALRAAGVPTTPLIAAAITHFEAWGAIASLSALATPEQLADLEARGLSPLE